MALVMAISVFSGRGPELPLWATICVLGGVLYGMEVYTGLFVREYLSTDRFDTGALLS
jgi:hypothetical protein